MKQETLTLSFATGEQAPHLVAKLIAECERRNNANPELIRINRNTWTKRNEQNQPVSDSRKR